MSNETEKYGVTITLTSEDYPSKAVTVDYGFTHSMVDRVLKGEHVPASYALAQTIATMLSMAKSKESFNYTDEELANMTPEQQEAAIREAAANAIHTIKMDRIP